MVLYVFSLTSKSSYGFISVFPHCQLTQSGFKVFSLTSNNTTSLFKCVNNEKTVGATCSTFLAPSATFLVLSFHTIGMSSQQRSSYNDKIEDIIKINIKLYLA